MERPKPRKNNKTVQFAKEMYSWEKEKNKISNV